MKAGSGELPPLVRNHRLRKLIRTILYGNTTGF